MKLLHPLFLYILFNVVEKDLLILSYVVYSIIRVCNNPISEGAFFLYLSFLTILSFSYLRFMLVLIHFYIPYMTIHFTVDNQGFQLSPKLYIVSFFSPSHNIFVEFCYGTSTYLYFLSLFHFNYALVSEVVIKF